MYIHAEIQHNIQIARDGGVLCDVLVSIVNMSFITSDWQYHKHTHAHTRTQGDKIERYISIHVRMYACTLAVKQTKVGVKI